MEKTISFTMRVGLTMVFALFVGVFLGDSQRVAHATTTDIPIVWCDPAVPPPNFWLCAVGQDPAGGGTAGMQQAPVNMHGALVGNPGYAATPPAGGRTMKLWVGAGGDLPPTLVNLTNSCIGMFAAARPGDVVVFYIATHGVRTAGFDGVPLDEPPADEEPNQPGTWPRPLGARMRGLKLARAQPQSAMMLSPRFGLA